MTRPGDNATAASQTVESLRKGFAGRLVELTQGKGSVGNVAASLDLGIDSPADGATIIGPDVTVQGSIINSTGVETGVTVNGIPATVSGSRFIANHVPLQQGNNIITITATDTNGLTSTTTRSVTASAGHYIRITSNIESGTAPLVVSLRIEGSFNITYPQITSSGTAAREFLPWTSKTELGARITSEGTMVVTASAVGPDGQTYTDSVTLTAISKTLSENLLKAKWEGLKQRIAAMDVEGAVTFLPSADQDYYRQLFTDLGTRLPLLSQDLPPFDKALESPFDSKEVPLEPAVSYVSASLPGRSIATVGGTEFLYSLASALIPVNATNMYVYLIYHGSGGTVLHGLKDISEPTPVDIFNDTDQSCVNGQWYNSGNEALTAADLAGNHNGVFDEEYLLPSALDTVYYKAGAPGTITTAPTASNNTLTGGGLLPGQKLRLGYILTGYSFDYAIDEIVSPPGVYFLSQVLQGAGFEYQWDRGFDMMYSIRGETMYTGAGVVYENATYPPDSPACPSH